MTLIKISLYSIPNFAEVFFYWEVSISTTTTLIFDIIVIPKITYFYWFIIITFLFKKDSNISNYSVFNCFIFFSCLKRFVFNHVFFRLFLYFQLAWFIFFFLLPYTICLSYSYLRCVQLISDVFVLNILTTLFLKSPSFC